MAASKGVQKMQTLCLARAVRHRDLRKKLKADGVVGSLGYEEQRPCGPSLVGHVSWLLKRAG